jgi:diguanylate cyclase (GGDEF)-like protein/PAS domain S-box-containing protein
MVEGGNHVSWQMLSTVPFNSLQNSADIICRFGLDQKLHYVSPASVDILGWTPKEMMAMEPLALVVPADIPVLVATIERNLVHGVTATPVAIRNRKKDGTVVWLEVTARVVWDPLTKEPTETVITMRDISERKFLEEKLAALALTDGLTGLANRRAFDEALEREWKRTLREGSQISLLMLDIDHFKQFNDLYGHQHGDDCLRAVATAVRNVVRRTTDIAARYGGEELAIILPCSGAPSALLVAEDVRRSIVTLCIPHAGNGEAGGMVTASIGVATALARHGGSMRMPETLLMSADHALYKAKHGGRNQVASTVLMASQTDN